MKVKLIITGKTSHDYLKIGISEYQNRLIHYLPFEIITIADLKNTKKLPEDQQRVREGEQILNHLQKTDYVVLLDENGKDFSSVFFAKWIEKQIIIGLKNLVFVIGGAYGFSKPVYERCNLKMALSKMTFSHQMVRLIFIEQLYRAMTILKGEPYHHQ